MPQIGAMYEGDVSRKRMLVEHGFRLPSAIDNRPLTWDEFGERIGQTIYLSATPGPYELQRVGGDVVEQVIRPTGLVDPQVIVKPTKGQIDDLLEEIRLRTERNERVLVTTLTKKMSEDLTDYLLENGVRARYLHSEVDTLRRIELLRELRLGEYDVLVGINLLREGLDLPEVSLVCDPGRGQGGLPALGDLADPDDRPGGAERLRRGAHVRRQDHPVDAARDRRDQPAAREAGRLQHRPRDRPEAAAQADRRHPGPDHPGGRRHRAADRRRRAAAVPGQVPGPRAVVPGARAHRGAARRPAGRPGRSRAAQSEARGDLVALISQLTDQMHAAAAELQFEVAARLRDEIKELKHELRGMQAAGV